MSHDLLSPQSEWSDQLAVFEGADAGAGVEAGALGALSLAAAGALDSVGADSEAGVELFAA